MPVPVLASSSSSKKVRTADRHALRPPMASKQPSSRPSRSTSIKRSTHRFRRLLRDRLPDQPPSHRKRAVGGRAANRGGGVGKSGGMRGSESVAGEGVVVGVSSRGSGGRRELACRCAGVRGAGRSAKVGRSGKFASIEMLRPVLRLVPAWRAISVGGRSDGSLRGSRRGTRVVLLL
jgi:hypothetical protein